MARRHAWGLSGLLAALVIAGLPSLALPSAAVADPCAADVVAAAELPAEVALDACDVTGATITADGLAVDVPPAGEGRSVSGLTRDGEVSLDVATTPDGVVRIRSQRRLTPSDPAPYAAAQQIPMGPAGSDAFAGAPALRVPGSFAPNVGQTFDVAQMTLEPGEPAPGCVSGAVGSLWYRIERPGTLRRIKLRADVPLAVYRGTALEGLQRIACIPAWSHDRRLTLGLTGTYYVQAALTQADAAAGKIAAHVTLFNGEMRPDGPPPCDARAFKLVENMGPRKPLKWRFHAASTPPSVTKTQALRAIKRGMGIIARSTNDCGLADTVSARHEYLGTTRKKASMCIGKGPDGVNSVSFGPAEQPGMLGLACSAWTISRTGRKQVFESDIRLTSTVVWTVQPDAPTCRQNVDMDLVGVAAHEAGHVFGLDHPDGAKGLNQTMSASMSACNGASRTLGRGDVVALRKLY